MYILVVVHMPSDVPRGSRVLTLNKYAFPSRLGSTPIEKVKSGTKDIVVHQTFPLEAAMRLTSFSSSLFVLHHCFLAISSLAIPPTYPQGGLSALERNNAFYEPIPLSKRTFRTHTFYNPSHSHRLTLTTFAAFLNQGGSTALLRLYTELLSNAAGPWASLPARSSFTLQCGHVYIEFAASEPYGVPWSFVAEFAEKMMKVTQKGFTGAFQGEYRHIETGAVILIGLRLAIAAAAA